MVAVVPSSPPFTAAYASLQSPCFNLNLPLKCRAGMLSQVQIQPESTMSSSVHPQGPFFGYWQERCGNADASHLRAATMLLCSLAAGCHTPS
jgi:hypothetical protein